MNCKSRGLQFIVPTSSFLLMQLFRALAGWVDPAERPGAARVAEALGLEAVPEASAYTDLFVFQLYPYASVYVGDEGMMGGGGGGGAAGWRGPAHPQRDAE